MPINTFLEPAHLQDVNMVLSGREKHKTIIEMEKSQIPIYSSKLEGLLNKQFDKYNLNGIYRV